MSVPLNNENNSQSTVINNDAMMSDPQTNNHTIKQQNSIADKVSVYRYTQTINYDKILEPLERQIVLLNFEDDTFKPVMKICNERIKIINEWYNTCRQLVDIEETNIKIPTIIKHEDIHKILYKNINCKHKDLFVSSYIPEMLNNITLQNKLRTMEKQMSICDAPGTTTLNVIKKTQSLNELNIIIPKNMLYIDDYFYIKDNTKFTCPKYKKNNISKPILNSNSILPVKSRYNKLTSDIVDGSLETLCQNANNDGCVSYNHEFNTLKPPFGSASLKINDVNTFFLKALDKLIIVLINEMFLQTIVIVNPNLSTIETIFENEEYGFIELFTFKTNNDEIETSINKQFNATIFNNIEEINQSLLYMSELIVSINNNQIINGPLLEEERTVKNYFKKYFKISDDINNKIKASILYDIIVEAQDECIIDKSKMSGFKNRLPNYLKDLGLQKKRYNDGYYYYGIVKNDEKIFDDKQCDIETNLEKLHKKRESLIFEMYNSNDFYSNSFDIYNPNGFDSIKNKTNHSKTT